MNYTALWAFIIFTALTGATGGYAAGQEEKNVGPSLFIAIVNAACAIGFLIALFPHRSY